MPTNNDAPQPPVDLSVIGPDSVPQDKPDDKAREEEGQYERSRKEVELEGLKQDLTERKDYAKKIFILICCWLVGMVFILLLQGAHSKSGAFNLSDAVLIAAIGGTTINVLGIFVVVVNYLFPKR